MMLRAGPANWRIRLAVAARGPDSAKRTGLRAKPAAVRGGCRFSADKGAPVLQTEFQTGHGPMQTRLYDRERLLP